MNRFVRLVFYFWLELVAYHAFTNSQRMHILLLYILTEIIAIENIPIFYEQNVYITFICQ